VTTADVLAGICVALFAGVWADRLRRRPLMIAADLGRAGIVGSVPIAAWFGVLRIEQLYAVAFLAGILTTFFEVAYRSYLPTLIDSRQLVEGNSKLTGSESVAEFASFSLAGWLVQLITAPGAMAVDAVSFLFSAASLGAIRTTEAMPAAVNDRRSVRIEIAEGITALWQDPRLRAMAASRVAFSAGGGIFSAVVLLFVTRELGVSAGVQGLIYSIGGLTSFAGAAAADWCRRRVGAGFAMIGGLTSGGMGMLLTALAPRQSAIGIGLLIVQQLVSDPGWTIYNINQTSLRQTIAPPEVLSRVTAAEHFGCLVAALLTATLAGIVADFAGARVSLMGGACCMFGGALILLASPVKEGSGA
jgi:Na+/melibiose symporter-like transporter